MKWLVLLVLVIAFSGCTQQSEPETTVATTTSSSTTTVAEAKACTEPIMFDSPPADLEKVEYIRPLGCLGGSHVTPIDHQYLITYASDVDVYSPADGNITNIQHMSSIPTGYEFVQVDDYRVVIQHTCTISSVFIHLDNLSEKILAVAPPPGEYANVKVPVVAGEVIGSYSGSLDYNVVDNDIELTGFVIPESYTEEWKTHIPDPFDYFNEPLRSQMTAKCLRSAEPIGGKIDYDIDGRLVGTWFRENTNKYDGIDPNNYWAGHLSVVYDCVDPEAVVISFGEYEGSPRDFGVKGNAPDPAESGVNDMVKYELVEYDYYDGSDIWDRKSLVKGLVVKNYDQVRGVVLFQLIEDRKLRMEIFPDKTASAVTGFTEAALIYER